MATKDDCFEGDIMGNDNKGLITAIGVGNAGCKAVEWLERNEVSGFVHLIYCNTQRALSKQGVGGIEIPDHNDFLNDSGPTTLNDSIHGCLALKPVLDEPSGQGQQLNIKQEIKEQLEKKEETFSVNPITEADLLFILVDIMEPISSEAAKIIASMRRNERDITVAVVSFPHRNREKHEQWLTSWTALLDTVDKVVQIPYFHGYSKPSNNAIQFLPDEVIPEYMGATVQAITDLVTVEGLISVDFSDIRAAMDNAGKIAMGVGHGSGLDRGFVAASRALSDPSLGNVLVSDAKGVLINITGGGYSMSLLEIDKAITLFGNAAHKGDALIVFGGVLDHTMGDQLRVSVVLTGLYI